MPAITLSAEYPDDTPRRAESDAMRRLRAEHADKVRRLQETILNLDNLLSPLDWLDAGDGFPGFGTWRLSRPATRVQDRTHAPLAYLNEEEWRQHVALARDLVTRNHLALGFRDHVSNFIGPIKISFVLRGHDPGASATGPEGAPTDPLVKECTGAWEEWCELAEWGQGEEDREAECRRRLLVEGEATLRFFVGDGHSNGLPYARHVEPELIRTPAGHSTSDRCGWGVVTADGDDEREEGLWLCDPGNVAEGRGVPSTEYVRVKSNVDRTVKRGQSDFFPVGESLRKVLGLLDNMAHVARLQAAIAWWEQYPTATMEQVNQQITMGADYQRPKLTGGSGSQTSVTGHEAGTVYRTEGGRVVVPGPTSQPTGFLAIEAAVLRSVGFRWGCPSYFSGEGDASFASVLVTGSPFVRITEDRQERSKAFAVRVATRVLEFCERSGRLPRGTARRVRAVATARPVVIADEEKKARTFLALYERDCADPVEYIRATGADPKVVAANIAAWKKQFPHQSAPPTPPAGPTPAPTDPKPAPPGSAGGDGSGSNEGDLFGEHVGTTPDGLFWVSEELYQRLGPAYFSEAKLDTSNKTLMSVPTKNGGTVKRWVRTAPKVGVPTAKPPGHMQQMHHDLVARVMGDPKSITTADLAGFGDVLPRLSKEELRKHVIAAGLNVSGPKQHLADRLLAHLTPLVAEPPPPITGTAGGKPSAHVNAQGKPSPHFKQQNPHATAAALNDPKAGSGPNRDLPDVTRPPVPDLDTARFINNYTWGYDKEMNQALRDTGAPPPGDFGGNSSGKPAKSGPAMYAALRGQFAKAGAFGPPPRIVERGITVSHHVAEDLLKEAQQGLATGHPIEIKGFVSTSTDVPFPGNVEYTIEAIHGLDVKTYSHYPYESELLLNHGCSYSVVSATRDPNTLRVKLHLRQLTTGA